MGREKADKFITVKQVADMTALSIKTIWAGKCGTDELLRIELGRRIMFSRNDVEAWIERRLQRARTSRRSARILLFAEKKEIDAMALRHRPEEQS